MMSRIYTSILCLFVIGSARGQAVPSSCSAPDSLVWRYQDDAYRLALRKIYQKSLPDTNSIHISEAHSDTMLRALLAVYNATALPARDTVVSLFAIHAFSQPLLHRFHVEADSSLPWMQQLRVGHIPTGNSSIDSLLVGYHFTVADYLSYSNVFAWHSALLTSDSSYNLPPLMKKFKALPGVYYCEEDFVAGDGNDITAAVSADRVTLHYSVGWGDCPAGCTSRRYWSFDVSSDCTVTYLGSSGNALPDTGVGIEEIADKAVSISPNPFSQTVVVRGVAAPFAYTLTDVWGRRVRQGKADGEISDLSALSEGLYLLTVQNGKHTKTVKIRKGR